MTLLKELAHQVHRLAYKVTPAAAVTSNGRSVEHKGRLDTDKLVTAVEVKVDDAYACKTHDVEPGVVSLPRNGLIERDGPRSRRRCPPVRG